MIQVTCDLSDFARAMDQAAEDLFDRMARGVGRGGERIANAAKRNLEGDARDRGGLLSGSINVKMAESIMAMQVKAEVGVGSGGDEVANFGIYVHEGTGIHSRTGTGRVNTPKTPVPWPYPKKEGGWGQTSGLVPNPYMENAYLSEKDNAMKDVAAAIGGG